MIKAAFSFFLFLPFASFSQNKAGKFYINPNAVLQKGIGFKSPIIGANLNAGLNAGNFGIGLGMEYFKVYSDLKAATPVFLDLRYFFKPHNAKNPLLPFAAVNAGKMIWSDSETHGASIDNFTTYYKGKAYISLETGIVFSPHRKKGIQASIGYKNYSFGRSGIHRTTLQQNGSIGPLVETKYPEFTDNNSQVFLKLGYIF